MASSAHTPGHGASGALGHYASDLLIASIIGTVALGLKPLPGLIGVTAPLALFAVVLMSWLLMRQHDRRLCEQCMLSMPLNPSEKANRYRQRFWMAHTGSQPKFIVPYLNVLISSNFATSGIGRIGWAAIQLSMVYLIMANTTHRKLQPWCPWCKDGGGGDRLQEEPPVLPHDDRLLV